MTATDRITAGVEHLVLFLSVALYPFAIYLGLEYYRIDPRLVYAVAGGVLALRFGYSMRYVDPSRLKRLLVPGIGVLLLLITGALLNDDTIFYLMPGLVSALLAVFFLRSLYAPPSMIESFALMSISDLTEETRRYCRRVTGAWVIFLFLNSIAVFVLTFYASRELWTLYTGVISYLLMGLFFAVEFGYRVWKFRQYRGYWFDPLLRWIFPPRGHVKPTYIPLRKLMVQGRRGTHPVSTGTDGKRTWDDLSRQVSGLSSKLLEVRKNTSPTPSRWIVTSDSAFDFCTGVLAAWQTEAVVAIPPGGNTDTLKQMVDKNTAGIISDHVSPDAVPGHPVIDPTAHADNKHDFDILDSEKPCLELFTSGSTGSRTAVRKNLSNLTEEIWTLEERWRDRLNDCTIVSTASHHHIYGLLFQVLWPLSAGRVFYESTALYPNEIVEAIKTSGTAGVCLVSTPAHLRRFVKFDDADSITDHVKIVFSSGGKLSGDTATQLRDLFGHAPVEIFGSTETGGIAWRVRDGADHSWQPFEPVSIRVEDTLRVQSPFVHEDLTEENGWFQTGDRCRRGKEGFVFEGRADREVNIADRRVSLEEVEQALQSHSFVNQARATSIERDAFDSTRRVVAAAVVPSEEGSLLLSDHDRKHVNRQLREDLTEQLAPVAIPKLFRYIEKLPHDERGKVTDEHVRTLFKQHEHRGNHESNT